MLVSIRNLSIYFYDVYFSTNKSNNVVTEITESTRRSFREV